MEVKGSSHHGSMSRQTVSCTGEGLLSVFAWGGDHQFGWHGQAVSRWFGHSMGTVFDVDQSVVELEECVDSVVGNAWPYLCAWGSCCDRVWCW